MARLHQQSGPISQSHRKIQSGEVTKVGNRCLRGLRPIGIDLFAENDLCLCFFSVRPSNGLFAAGARFEKSKWSADAMFMWAALSAQRKNPLVEVNLDLILGDAMAGREILPNLYVEGGVRRLALDIHATVGSSSARRSPSYWDPLVGLTCRRQLGRKWRILIHGDGGGFGVGSDVDVTATARAEWQCARHFGIAMGYGGMHFSDSNTVDGKTLKISPTLHGPTFGFGIFF